MDSGSATQQATPPRQCDICNKTFVRSEHLERHRRTHTKEKPFTCPHCPRSFQRSDVRAQHVKKSHQQNDTLLQDDATTEPSRKRVKVACDTCRKRKLRCDAEKPCRQCLLGGSACQYSSTAITTQSRTNHDSQDSSTVQNPIGEVEIELHHYHDGQPPTPGTTPDRGVATLIDPSLQLDSVQAPFIFALEPDSSRPANEMPMTESSDFACLDPRFSFENDIEHAMMTDFWQEPVLNGGSWLNGLDLGIDDFISLIPDHALASSSLQKYSLCMHEYFNRKSRPSSPPSSPNKAASMWYSAPASLSDHDPEIVNVFLNMFSRNVPNWFKLFQDSIFTVETRPEFILAAAAVGGLYCSINGSFEFSKAMYNDSRRLLLASTKSSFLYNRDELSCADMLTVVKTFILHELYGLCSGDQRSYEFVEAFHQDLIKAVQVLVKLHEPEIHTIADKDMARLLETLYILDCYRVVLLQRPPSLLWQHLDGFPKSPASQQEQGPFSHLRNLIRGITNPGLAVETDAIREFSLATLSGLSPFLWHAMLLTPADQDSGKTLCNTDFVELAADKWLRSHQYNVEPSSQMLHHLINITMHANLLVIQNYAHSPPTSGERDKGKESCQTRILQWARGRHHKIAKWHAERLLECAETAISAGSEEEIGLARPSTVQHSISSPEPSRSMIDVVHVPYCIYYSTLVLWCGAEVLDGSNALVRQSYLTRGRHILAQQSLRIAPLLERVLRGVKK